MKIAVWLQKFETQSIIFYHLRINESAKIWAAENAH
jgi:hypothetical protein